MRRCVFSVYSSIAVCCCTSTPHTSPLPPPNPPLSLLHTQTHPPSSPKPLHPFFNTRIDATTFVGVAAGGGEPGVGGMAACGLKPPNIPLCHIRQLEEPLQDDTLDDTRDVCVLGHDVC